MWVFGAGIFFIGVGCISIIIRRNQIYQDIAYLSGTQDNFSVTVTSTKKTEVHTFYGEDMIPRSKFIYNLRFVLELPCILFGLWLIMSSWDDVLAIFGT